MDWRSWGRHLPGNTAYLADGAFSIPSLSFLYSSSYLSTYSSLCHTLARSIGPFTRDVGTAGRSAQRAATNYQRTTSDQSGTRAGNIAPVAGRCQSALPSLAAYS